jgi:L-lactate dehydrogenase (cytochrome)
MKWEYNVNYPAIDDLRNKAKRKVPKFAFEYLEGGCNENVNLYKNTAELREVELLPYYLSDHHGSDLKTELFGHVYDAPFGICPIGLQGIDMAQLTGNTCKGCLQHNIPFILSTVTTSSIERISELTEGRAWYQLYHPAEDSLRDDIIKRLEAAKYPVLVLLCDVPSFGYRPWDIRNGLAMPPRMTLKNILQIMTRPEWAFKTLYHGTPGFATMKPYMPKD